MLKIDQVSAPSMEELHPPRINWVLASKGSLKTPLDQTQPLSCSKGPLLNRGPRKSYRKKWLISEFYTTGTHT